jgi:hypothetical protein
MNYTNPHIEMPRAAADGGLDAVAEAQVAVEMANVAADGGLGAAGEAQDEVEMVHVGADVGDQVAGVGRVPAPARVTGIGARLEKWLMLVLMVETKLPVLVPGGGRGKKG